MIEKLDLIGKDNELKMIEKDTHHKTEINKKLKKIEELKHKHETDLKTQIDKGNLDLIIN